MKRAIGFPFLVAGEIIKEMGGVGRKANVVTIIEKQKNGKKNVCGRRGVSC